MSTQTKNPGEGTDEVKQPTAEEIKKSIEDHKQAAAHHQEAAARHIEAAKHHLEAAKNHEEGDHEKPAKNTALAYGHSAIAGGFVNDDAKHHSQQLKETKYQ